MVRRTTASCAVRRLPFFLNGAYKKPTNAPNHITHSTSCIYIGADYVDKGAGFYIQVSAQFGEMDILIIQIQLLSAGLTSN